MKEVSLWKAHAYVLRQKLHDSEGKATVVMLVPPLLYHLLITEPCMKIFFLTGFQDYFRMKPCEVDARRIHEFMTTLQGNGACILTSKDGE